MSDTSQSIDGAVGVPPVAETTDAPAPAVESDTVHVSLDGPWYLSRFVVTTPEGATLIIDRGGVSVDHLDVEAVQKAANANGVSLRIGK